MLHLQKCHTGEQVSKYDLVEAGALVEALDIDCQAHLKYQIYYYVLIWKF
jgi:hypothetical protein